VIRVGKLLEEKILDLTRKGDMEKVKFLRGLRQRVMPSQLKKIHRGEKSIMRELFLPKWVSWELLFDWASDFKEPGNGRECVLCGNRSELGIDLNEKFICEGCFVKIKNLK
jgi:hypothetical protein